jgi:hypothetical protein
VLTEAQVIALEKAKTEKEAHGEFESEHPGYCGAQDTFYVGNLKGVGRIYQQTFIDTYTKVSFAKLYDRKTPITAADLLWPVPSQTESAKDTVRYPADGFCQKRTQMRNTRPRSASTFSRQKLPPRQKYAATLSLPRRLLR